MWSSDTVYRWACSDALTSGIAAWMRADPLNMRILTGRVLASISDEQLIDGCTAGQTLAELNRFGGQLFVGKGGGCGFERVDARRAEQPRCAGRLHG